MASAKHLNLISEVSIKVLSKSYKIFGIVDWILDHDEIQKNLLIAGEAKSYGELGRALPQLLFYLAGLQDARAEANKTNRTVFGVITDSVTYLFVLLNSNRKAFILYYLDWTTEFNSIIVVLDWILDDAINTPTHSTLIKC